MIDEITPTPETMLLGIALTDRRALDDAEHLSPDDFEDEQAAGIWATILRQRGRNRPHDVAAVAAVGDHDLDQLQELAYTAPLGATADYYADLVSKQAVRRRLQQTGTRIAQLAQESDLDQIAEAVEIARAEVDAAGNVGGTLEGITVGDYFPQHLVSLDQPVQFVPTPWADLNHLIGGWRPGALYVVGARPSHGKSIIGLQAAVGLQRSGAVLFSSLEMSKKEVMNRAIAQIVSVPLGAFDEPLEDRFRQRLAQHGEEIRGMRVHMDDRGAVLPTDIRSSARSLARRGPLAGIVVDYLQLMKSARGDRRPRHEVVADYSRSLKLLAKELHVPVIALAQLNRNSTQGDQQPRVSDLRESGAVEQDADVVILLHQPEDRSDQLFMRVGKNRHGQKGNFELILEGAYARASDHHWTSGVGSHP